MQLGCARLECGRRPPAMQNGGSRASAVISDHDAALESFRGLDDLPNIFFSPMPSYKRPAAHNVRFLRSGGTWPLHPMRNICVEDILKRLCDLGAYRHPGDDHGDHGHRRVSAGPGEADRYPGGLQEAHRQRLIAQRVEVRSDDAG